MPLNLPADSHNHVVVGLHSPGDQARRCMDGDVVGVQDVLSVSAVDDACYRGRTWDVGVHVVQGELGRTDSREWNGDIRIVQQRKRHGSGRRFVGADAINGHSYTLSKSSTCNPALVRLFALTPEPDVLLTLRLVFAKSDAVNPDPDGLVVDKPA